MGPQTLQSALDEAVRQFPFYCSVMKRGLFWNYLEDRILRGAAWLADRQATASFSNVGKITMPKEMEPYIHLFGAFTSPDKLQASVTAVVLCVAVLFCFSACRALHGGARRDGRTGRRQAHGEDRRQKTGQAAEGGVPAGLCAHRTGAGLGLWDGAPGLVAGFCPVHPVYLHHVLVMAVVCAAVSVIFLAVLILFEGPALKGELLRRLHL